MYNNIIQDSLSQNLAEIYLCHLEVFSQSNSLIETQPLHKIPIMRKPQSNVSVYLIKAFSNCSLDAISKLFVGSSRIRRLGDRAKIVASLNLARSPGERKKISAHVRLCKKVPLALQEPQ